MTTGTVRQEPLAEHGHDQTRSERAGVLLLIVADVAFVLSLVFTYFYLRGLNTDDGWIPKGSATLSPVDGWLIAGLVVLSALVYRWGELRDRAGQRGQLITATAVGLILLLADLALQLWRMVTLPFGVGTGSYASMIMVMGGAHVFHLILTAVLGLAIWNRARRGLSGRAAGWQVRMVGYWWYWVAISAVIIAFTTSFVAVPHAA